MTGTKFARSAQDLTGLTAEYLMDPTVAVFESTDRCGSVIVSMVKDHAGGIPIVDGGGRLAGIVTEFDLLGAIVEGKDLARTAAGEIMTGNPVTVSERAPAAEILETLRGGCWE